jgi:hypothetical protein
MTLSESEVNANSTFGSGAFGGGGILNSQITIADGPGVLTLVDSEVVGNFTSGNGGGIDNGFNSDGFLGGVVTLSRSRVTLNVATQGGGIINFSGAVALSMSTVSSNTPDNCEPTGTIAGCVG